MSGSSRLRLTRLRPGKWRASEDLVVSITRMATTLTVLFRARLRGCHWTESYPYQTVRLVLRRFGGPMRECICDPTNFRTRTHIAECGIGRQRVLRRLVFNVSGYR